MKIKIGLIALCLGCAVLVGCMHTVIGGNPVRSPDKLYRLGIRIHGASAKAYVARSKKRVYLWLGSNTDTNRTTHINKKYVFNAAGLDWNVQWHGSDKVSVDFYDFGDGVSVYDARKTRAPSNHIATLTFQLDQQTHRFIEIKE